MNYRTLIRRAPRYESQEKADTSHLEDELEKLIKRISALEERGRRFRSDREKENRVFINTDPFKPEKELADHSGRIFIQS